MKITDKILSAWIDESLSSKQMRAVSAAVQSDSELRARADALRAVGVVLREESFDPSVSAERMLSDVRRAIRLQDSARVRPTPFWIRRLRWAPAGAAVCVCLALTAIWLLSHTRAEGSVAQTKIEYVDSELSDASPMVYTDYEAGWTIVWLDGVELEPGI